MTQPHIISVFNVSLQTYLTSTLKVCNYPTGQLDVLMIIFLILTIECLMEKPDDYLVSDFDIKTLIAILSLGRTGHFKVHSPGAKNVSIPMQK